MANESVGRISKIKAEAVAILEEKGVELQDQDGISRARRYLHFWVMVVNSFIRNRCPVRATALAYTTLLALIPLLAVVVSVSTSLLKTQGDEPIKGLIDKLVANVAPQLDLVPKAQGNSSTQVTSPEDGVESQGREEVQKKIKEYISNVRSGTLGVTGAVSLILVAILLLSNIEATFNDIWGVTRGRSWFARVVYYWAAITLGPIILMVALGLTSSPHIEATKKLLVSMPFIGKWLFSMVPFLLLISAFSFFYGLMPNTRVHWRAALVGGIVGGTLWQLNNLFNVMYVSKVVTYSKIYGSFSMVPLFLIGMYISWLILLFGSQVAYAHQNRRAYLQEKLAEGVNHRSREFVALRTMTLAAQRFQQGEKPPSALEISTLLGAPSRLISQVLQVLVKAKLLLEVSLMEIGYTPARPLDQITCKDVLEAMQVSQGSDLLTREESARAIVRQEFDRIRQAEEQVAASTTLLALVTRVSSQPRNTEPIG